MPGGRVDTTARIPALRMEEQSSDPAAPAAGYRLIYPKAGGWYGRKSDGTVELLTGLSNPMTTAGDIIIGGASGTPTRLAPSTNGHVLTLVSGSPAWQAPSGGGGASISRGAYASRPAAGTAGRLYLASNSPIVSYDDGSVWRESYAGWELTPPVLADFTWVNQGTATTDTTRGGILVTAPAVAGDNLRILKKAAPATPYTITVGFLTTQAATGTGALVIWRDGANALIINGLIDAIGMSARKLNSPTSFNSFYVTNSQLEGYLQGALFWLRIRDNGTTRFFEWSADKSAWWQIHSVGRTDFFTPTEVGFAVQSGNATNAATIWLLSWEQS